MYSKKVSNSAVIDDFFSEYYIRIASLAMKSKLVD